MSRVHCGDQAFDYDSLLGTETEMPFSGARSFMRRRLTRNLAGVDYAVMGIPYDLSTSGRPGTRLAPEAVRRATSQLSWGEVWPWNFDPFDRLAVVDYGDVFYQRGQPQEMLRNAHAQALHVLKSGARLITIGGDHLITYPLLKAHAEVHGPLALIQFDAHRDTAKSDFLDHGSFVRFAMNEGLIDPAKSIQIGIRTHLRSRRSDHRAAPSMGAPERRRCAGRRDRTRHRRHAVLSHLRHRLRRSRLCARHRHAGGRRADAARGVRHDPRPHKTNIVGMDLVEVSPPYDPTEVTALLGLR